MKSTNVSLRNGTERSMAKSTNGGRCYGMKQSTVNRTVGGHFEEELCKMLAERGWWAHNMAQNQVGQPADVIAVKNNIAVLIDCKVCANNRFPLSRIECNQEGAMTVWEARGNAYCYFAMKLANGDIYMVSFDDLSLRQLYGEGSITEKEFPMYHSFDQWVEFMEEAGC